MAWSDEEIREMALDRAVRFYAEKFVSSDEIVAAAERFATFLRGAPTSVRIEPSQ